MPPFRSDLEAANARKEKLARELEDAEEHAAALRAKQEGAEPALRHKAKPGKRSLRWRSKRLLWFPCVVLGLFVLMPAFGNMVASSCGYRASVIRAVEDCPEAKELLGDDIHFGRFGIACGSTSVGDTDVGYDHAQWRMPISGSQASGVYSFRTEDRGQGWTLRSGQVEIDDVLINLGHCSQQKSNMTSTPASTTRSNAEGELSPSALLIGKCEAGEARACRDLGLLFELGNTVEKDPERAQLYAQEACKLGLQSACVPTTQTPEDSQ